MPFNDEDELVNHILGQEADDSEQESVPDLPVIPTQAPLPQAGAFPMAGSPSVEAPKVPLLAAKSPGPTPEIPPDLQSYLSSKFQDSPEMVEAKKKRDTSQLLAGLGGALNTISNGVGGHVSNDVYSQMSASADKPVQDLVTQQRLGAARQKAITDYLVRKQNAQNKADSVGVSKEGLKEKHRHNIMLEKILAGKRETAASDKQSKEQDQALQQAVTLLESNRGNPATQQAERDLYAAAKAKSIKNQYGGDLNKVPAGMKHVLVMEIAKMASGSVPTESELKALDEGTLVGSLAQAWGRLSNAPAPANSGEFLKGYMDYADNLQNDAKEIINDKYGRVIEANKRRLGDSNYAHLQDVYMNRFKAPENSKPAATVAPQPTASAFAPFSDPDKEKRYQEWKASQGK